MKRDEAPVRIEAVYSVPPAAVWQALSTAESLRGWSFEQVAAFRPEPGFETCFVVASGGREFPHRWTVLEAEPGRRLVLRWRYDGYAGDSIVRFELEAVAGGTRVVLTHQATADFPADIPEFSRENCEAGWRWLLDSLGRYLAGRK
ncbi:MAG: SRPBCC domain-containing protein [Verrucomicrobia bacterium]|nr:MAG: SRPBCC domain-containing protein [Verrucomicrobiota bacterium]